MAEASDDNLVRRSLRARRSPRAPRLTRLPALSTEEQVAVSFSNLPQADAQSMQ